MFTVGVVVGRFQVAELHAAHKALLRHASANCDRLLILVGVPAIQGTFRNPLDFQTRQAMLHKEVGLSARVTILPIHDRESDQLWSEQLDEKVSMIFPDADHVTLFHARDGFGDHYHGRFECVDVTKEIPADNCSGTEARQKLGATVSSSSGFRHGVIYASQHTWPHIKMAVDTILYKEPHLADGGGHMFDGSILVGRKAHETKWRLPGGLVDPTDHSLESAARRELMEETGVSFEGGVQYVCSRKVADWRYGGLPNEAIFTTCFSAPYFSGAIRAGDDLAEVKWVAYRDAMSEMRSEHAMLVLEFFKAQGVDTREMDLC